MGVARGRAALLGTVLLVAPVMVWLTPGVLPAAARAAQEPTPAEDDFGDGDFGEPEEVEIAPAVDPPAAPFWMELLGYFHSATVHFPIAWMMLVVVLEAGPWVGRSEWRSSAAPVLILGVLSFGPGIATGLSRAEILGSDPEIVQAAVDHRNVIFAAAIFALVALAVRWQWSQTQKPRLRLVYWALLVASLTILGYGGHLGGEMVYGEPPL